MKKWMLYLLAAMAIMGGKQSAIPPVLRLHVVANSDCAEDQSVKLKVRDEITDYMSARAAQFGSFPEAYQYAKNHREEISALAARVLKENGFDYGAKASVGIYPFPDKTYGTVTFPQGDYYALRVELGDAAGANWWCVLFPPLCFVEQIRVEDGWREEDGVEYRSLIGEFLGLQ